jgi:hypothetical protein
MHAKSQSGNLTERGLLEELGVHGMTILKWSLKIQVAYWVHVAQDGFSGGSHEHDNEYLGFLKDGNIFLPTERLSASQK